LPKTEVGEHRFDRRLSYYSLQRAVIQFGWSATRKQST